MTSSQLQFNQAVAVAEDVFNTLIAPSLTDCYDLSNCSNTINTTSSTSFVLTFPFQSRILSLSEMTMYTILHTHFFALLNSHLQSVESISLQDLHSSIMTILNSMNFH